MPSDCFARPPPTQVPTRDSWPDCDAKMTVVGQYTLWPAGDSHSSVQLKIRTQARRRPGAPSQCPISQHGAVVRPIWGRSFAVSGKMPQRNTHRARGKPVLRLGETLVAVPRPCSAGSYESRRDSRLKHAETPAGRERPPRKRPWLGRQAFRRGRSRDFSLQEGRAAPKGREGVRHNGSDCRAPLSGCVVGAEGQCLAVSGFDMGFDRGDSIRLPLPSTN